MPSPQFEAFLEASLAQRTGAPPDIAELRAAGELVAQMLPAPDGTECNAVDAGGVPGEWVAEAGTASDRVILYLHGGGYCIWSPRPYRNYNARLSAATGARVLAPDYRLGPENPFPAAVDDACATYRWLLAQGVSPEKIAVSGDSAGGGLTLALLLALRDAGDPLPACAVPISPWIDVELTGEVSDDAIAVDLLRPEQLKLFADNYLAGADPRNPLANALHADLSGLPPMLVMVGEREILLDDAKRFASKATETGLDVTLHIAPGMVHIWQMWGGMFPEANEASDLAAAYIKERVS